MTRANQSYVLNVKAQILTGSVVVSLADVADGGVVAVAFMAVEALVEGGE